MSDKEASNVVTSENSADFYSQKLGLTNETPVEAVVEETPAEPTEEVVEDEPSAEEEAKTTGKKKGIDKRFKELTSERELARQEADRERQARIELENQLKEIQTRTEQSKKGAEVDPEPQPSQFGDMVEYYKALSEWNTDKAMRERDQRELQARMDAEKARVMSSWNEKQNKFKSENPDYEEKVKQLQFPASQEVQDAILTSDFGAEVLYHLGKNPDLAKKIVEMPLTKALKELGKIEAQFESKPEEKPVVTKSNAPKPISPLKATSSAADTPIGSDGQFHGTYQQWKEARKAGKIR
jgi:hypothetical protein